MARQVQGCEQRVSSTCSISLGEGLEPPEKQWTGEQINTVGSLHTGECISAVKEHATTWVSIEVLLLSEISLSRKDKYCVIPPI